MRQHIDLILAGQLCSIDQSQYSSGYASQSQNHKLNTIAVCGLVFSYLIGSFLATQ